MTVINLPPPTGGRQPSSASVEIDTQIEALYADLDTLEQMVTTLHAILDLPPSITRRL